MGNSNLLLVFQNFQVDFFQSRGGHCDKNTDMYTESPTFPTG
jgi:hypothetical protein